MASPGMILPVKGITPPEQYSDYFVQRCECLVNFVGLRFFRGGKGTGKRHVHYPIPTF
jgi:hypothetical protein